MKYCLAIDIGASSGRHIVGHMENGEIVAEEVYRFENGVKEADGHLVWDIDYLEEEVRKGIDEAASRYEISSLSIDTWGVDYVLLRNDEIIYPVYAYRDARTEEVIDEVHALMPFAELYEHTGCQFQPFNSIYQLYWDKVNGRLDEASDYLMMPEYLMYRLSGKKLNEFTNATTTGMISRETLEFDEEIIDRLSLPKRLFRKLQPAGTPLGTYKGIDVVLCATHDTGSAVEGIPMEGNEPYISSGTWSLLGIKTDRPITTPDSMEANYSNEGGIGYNRYQKNIMGMWLINELKRELCEEATFADIVRMAKDSSFNGLIDANDSDFLSPVSMKEAFDRHLAVKPKDIGDYFRCAYLSLANSYREAIEELERNTGKTYRKIYIVGGGAKSGFLNELTEEYTGKEVIALPIEATALGNLKVQLS